MGRILVKPNSLVVSKATMAGSGTKGALLHYETDFFTVENPLSEGGKWAQHDPNLTACAVTDEGGVHVVHGIQAGGGFDDSSGVLTAAFSRSHGIRGKIFKSSGFTGNCEVELHLAWSDQNAPHNTDFGDTTTVLGYEFNIHHGGSYAFLGRFKALPALVTCGTVTSPANNDILEGTYVYNVGSASADINIKLNGTSLPGFPFHDTSPPITGKPGIGFFVDHGADKALFGFKRVEAFSLDDAA